MAHWSDYMHILAALLVITNPIGAIPVFITLTRDQSSDARRKTARITATAVAVVLIISIFLGEPLLRFFGIGLPSFRVGGGILILMMALAMLRGYPGETRHSPEEHVDAEDKDTSAVVPLAIPLLAGPGAISLAIVDAHQAGSWPDKLLFSLGIVGVAAIVWMILRLAEPIGQRLGTAGLNIATRVMGLILAAMAVQFMADGLLALFPGLSR